MTPEERFQQFLAKVDAFFARVSRRYSNQLACAPGCSDCCHQRLSITGIEAAFLHQGLSSLPDHVRTTLAQRATTAPPNRCPALGPDQHCEIYPWRPVVCRTHGLPIRFRQPGTLPVLQTCSRNFLTLNLDTVDPDCILDQYTVSTVLAALDAAHADAHHRPRGQRFDLTTLLSQQNKPHPTPSQTPPLPCATE